MEFQVIDDEPQLDFKVVDDEAEDESARLTWAGRPTTMAAVERVAKNTGSDIGSVLNRFADRFERNLAQNVPGASIVLRAGEGIKEAGEFLAESGARVAGNETLAAAIHENRRKRNEFLQHIEKGNDAETLLGTRGARIFSQAAQSIGGTGTAAVLTGPLGAYSYNIGKTWEDSLDEGQRSGLAGGELLLHAGTASGIEAVFSVGMGLAGNRLGFESLEQSFSPAARSAVRNAVPKSALQKVASELGGITSEGVEELLISAGQQVNEMASGIRDSFDVLEMLEAGASGVAGRGAVGAINSLQAHLDKVRTNLPEIASGTRAAEIDLERGMNPLEVTEYLSDSKEFERQTGRSGTSKQYRDSYRDAIDFYLKEARDAGNTSAMERYETDLAALRAEDKARADRVRQSKQRAKTGKSKTAATTTTAAPQADIPPAKTADQRAQFSLADFEARALPPLVGTTVEPAATNVNPYILAPWEPETRQQRRIRMLSQDVAKHKETIGSLRESFKNSKRLREDQLGTARQLVQENIPRNEQWKYFSDIQKAKSPAAVDKLLTKVDAAIDARNHRLAVMDLKQSLKKATNLRTEFAEQVKQLRGQVDLKTFGDRNAAVNVKLYAERNPNALLTDKEKDVLDRWDKTNVNDMSVDDVRSLSEVVQRLAYDSKVKDRILGNQQSGHIRDIGDTIAQEAAASPKLAVNEDQERAWSSFVLLEAAERPEATLSRISPTLNDHIYNKLAIVDQNNYDMAAKHVTETLAEMFEGVGLKDNLVEWRDHKRLLSGVDLTRGEAMMIWRWMQDPHAAKSVMKAGVSLDDGKRVLPPFTPKMLAELADFVGDQGQAISQFMFDYDNGTLIDSVNETNETLTGRPLTHKKDVVPIVRSDQEFATFMSSGRAGYQQALLDSYRSFKHRTEGEGQLAIPKGMDAIDMFMTHADRMNRFAAFGVNSRNAEMLLNDPAVKKAVLAKNGKQGWNHLVDAVRAHVVGNKPRSMSEKLMAQFNAATSAALIALRPTVLLQQALDPLTAAAWDENGLTDLGSGYSELNQRGLQAVEEEMERVLGQHSGNYWRRYKSGDYVGEHTSGQFKTQSHFRPSALTQKVMHPMTRAEFFASAIPNYMSAKAAARRRFGLPEDDFTTHEDNSEWTKSIVEAWDKKTYRGSNSSHGLELSGILRYAKDNPASALVLNFYNTASKVYSLWTMGVTKARQGHVGQASAFLTSAVVNGAMVAIIQQALTLGAGDEEESFWKKTLNRLAGGLSGLHPLSDNILTQNVVEPVVRTVLDMKQRGFQTDNPVLVAEVAGKMAQHGTKAVIGLTELAGQAYDPDKVNRELIEAGTGFLTLRGIPAEAVRDLYRRSWRELEAAGVLPENKLEKEKR